MKRRQFIRLHKEIFDNWLENIFPADIAEFHKLRPIKKSELGLRLIVKEAIRRGVKLRKDLVVDELIRAFDSPYKPTVALFQHGDIVHSGLKHKGAPLTDADKGMWIRGLLTPYIRQTPENE